MRQKANQGVGIVGFIIIVFIVIALFKACSSMPDTPPPREKTPQEIRTDEISQGFSAWDGSHLELTRWIKKNLKDPSSYDHVETKYVDNGGDVFIVMTKYRATNSFGAVMPGFTSARVHVVGRVIEVITSE